MHQLQMSFRETRWEGGDGDTFQRKLLSIMVTHFSTDHLMALLGLSSGILLTKLRKSRPIMTLMKGSLNLSLILVLVSKS
jgi:hypothetical protein